MLDTLTDMEVANTIMKTTTDKKKDAEEVNMLDKRFKELNMDEMTPLEHSSKEYKALANYLVKSSGQAHGLRYRLEDIFRIQRTGEDERFETSEFSKLHKSDKRLLWHGSRTTNYGGILSQGLRIAPPEAPVNGYAFGKGVYLADISSKSAQYCQPGMSGNTGLLLLIEAELGKPMYEIPTGDSMAEEQAKKHKCISTLGVGRTAPQGWMDAEVVNEVLKGVTMVSSFLLILCFPVFILFLFLFLSISIRDGCRLSFPPSSFHDHNSNDQSIVNPNRCEIIYSRTSKKASATTKPRTRMDTSCIMSTSATMSRS